MAVYLYAVCADEIATPPINGVHRPRLRMIRAAGLSAVVGDDVPAGAVGEDEMWQHEDTIEQLMGSCDLLPARFGSVLGDDAEIRGLLLCRQREFSCALRRVAGAVELSVRAIWHEAPVSESHDGTGYLAARAEGERRIGVLARTLEGKLAPLARASRLRTSGVAGTQPAGAYLVAREMVGDFTAEVNRLAAELLDATLVCTGPWPPYSFVEAEAGAA